MGMTMMKLVRLAVVLAVCYAPPARMLMVQRKKDMERLVIFR
jgi:hypothetical protein